MRPLSAGFSPTIRQRASWDSKIRLGRNVTTLAAKASLDDIEHGTLRPLLGYRAHAVLVCAARSCPPLQRFSYTAPQLDEQIDTAYGSWLPQRHLNRVLSDQRKIEISSIFDLFKED